MRFPSMFDLSMGAEKLDRLSEKEGEFRLRETVEVLVDLDDWLGSILSFVEWMDKSSPFHKSPHSWLFYFLSA